MGAAINPTFSAPALSTAPRTEGLAPPFESGGPAIYTPPLEAPSRWGTLVSFFISDAIALAAATGICAVLYTAIEPAGLAAPATWFVLVFVVLGLAYAASGLYSSVAAHPAEEIRRMSLVTTVVVIVLVATVGFRSGITLEMGLLAAAAWLTTTTMMSLGRLVSRLVCARTSWWGYPVVVVGQGAAGIATIKTLKRWPELGYKPVALLSDSIDEKEVDGVPLCGTAKDAFALAQHYEIPDAIVAMPELSQRQLIELVGRYSKFFDRIVVVPGLSGLCALWTNGRSPSGVVGFEVQHPRRKRATLFFKRIMDICGALAGLTAIAPLFVTICALIKLDSPGPVFYRQLRLGKGGHVFNVLKFRTMHSNAEEILRELLLRDPELRAEYGTFHKLRRDPRVTPIGRLLRRYSLDELPQLWNVLRGEMSLVGSRAFMPDELSRMDGMEHIILQSRPGITGLWQVSGRNNLSFEERVSMSVHYTHNWNFWLDAYILVRTVPVVLTGEGAC